MAIPSAFLNLVRHLLSQTVLKIRGINNSELVEHLPLLNLKRMYLRHQITPVNITFFTFWAEFLVNSFEGNLNWVWHDLFHGLIVGCKLICYDIVFTKTCIISKYEILSVLEMVSFKDITLSHFNQTSLKLKKLFIKLKHLIWFIIESFYFKIFLHFL